MYYSTTRLNRLSKALATGKMLYDMARTLSLTRHRRIFSLLLTQHRFLMLFLFFVSYADCLSIHRRPQYTVLRLPGSECFDHCSQCLFRRVNLHTIPDRFDFIYYSFGMMTQLGAAGIAAVTDQARSVSVIEAILGQLYLAVLISRLIASYRITPPAANS